MISAIDKLNKFYYLDLEIQKITSKNNEKQRDKILDNFANNNQSRQLLFSVRILDECIDIPQCDSNGSAVSSSKRLGCFTTCYASITERSEKPEVFESHKPKDIDRKTKKGKIIEVWGLTLCENKNCSLIHNRDKNSALNMYKITQSIFEGKGRPEKYCREIKNK
jgi:hypothetical protein